MKFIPLCSGSSGNATYIETADGGFLVDAGVSRKRLVELLALVGVKPENIRAILVTHEHTDHIKGIEMMSKKFGIPVYANSDCWSARRGLRAHCPGIPPECMCVFESDVDFYIGRTRVFPFTTHHDAEHSVGYTLTSEGRTAAVCTDIGHVDKRILNILSPADILLFEANHDLDMLMAGPYPYDLKKRIASGNGHLSNEDCGRALVSLYAAGVRSVILGHLSEENNFPQLAVETVKCVLAEAGITDMRLALAGRYEPTGVFTL